MAKLFGEMEDARGVEVHKIANEQLCARIYYGRRDKSTHAVTVCATIVADPLRVSGSSEKAVVVAEFISPAGYPIHFHREEYPMPEKKVLLKAVAV